MLMDFALPCKRVRVLGHVALGKHGFQVIERVPRRIADREHLVSMAEVEQQLGEVSLDDVDIAQPQGVGERGMNGFAKKVAKRMPAIDSVFHLASLVRCSVFFDRFNAKKVAVGSRNPRFLTLVSSVEVIKPVFLDRDGVINVDITPYVATVDQLEIFPYAVSAMKRLHDAGLTLFVVSNQQGVAKGITTPEQLEKITEAIQDACRESGFEIAKFYYCTALKGENSSWRKPSPGMLLAAADEYGFDLNGCYLVGDKWSDMEAAARAGATPLLVYSGVTPPGEEGGWKYPPQASFPTLAEAADYVVEQTAIAR